MKPTIFVVPLLVVVSLSACSSGGTTSGPTAVTRPTGCPPNEAPEIRPECVEDSQDFDAVATPTGAAPSGSDAIAPVTLAKQPGDLALGGNEKDPAKTTQTFTVTVPAGSRLRTTAACEGRNQIAVTVSPQSAAAQEFTCGFEGAPAELTVEDSMPVRSPTTFTVTVTAKPPSRWFVAIGATDAPPPPDTASQG